MEKVNPVNYVKSETVGNFYPLSAYSKIIKPLAVYKVGDCVIIYESVHKISIGEKADFDKN